jgi:hypothetical protein
VKPHPPPAVIIRIPFERGPQVLCDYLDEDAQARMLDWLIAHPELLRLIQEAIELREAA